MKQITIGIDGMMCSMCEAHINDAIRQNLNVKKVSADRTKKHAVIVADQDITEEQLHAVIDPTGYTMTSYTVEPYKKKGLFGF